MQKKNEINWKQLMQDFRKLVQRVASTAAGVKYAEVESNELHLLALL